MTRDQIVFVLFSPVILAAHVAAGASEAAREFLREWATSYRELGQ